MYLVLLQFKERWFWRVDNMYSCNLLSSVLFDVVVVVVVVTLGVSLPALLLGFLHNIQVGGVSKLAI